MTDRIQAQCVVAPGQALLEIWRIDHTCYWFPFTHAGKHSQAHTFQLVGIISHLSDQEMKEDDFFLETLICGVL